MQVDIVFGIAKVYNVEKFDVAKGQEFVIETDRTEASQWFSDNDPVLSLKVQGNGAHVIAKETGPSTILIMNESRGVEKTLTINVVDSVLPDAVDLGASADNAVNK